MNDPSGTTPGTPNLRRSLNFRLGRLSTGMKMFLLLSIALLPLVIIIVFASLQTTSAADFERRSLLRVALNESARRLGSEIATDVTALRMAANAYASGVAEPQICSRTASILSSAAGRPTQFAIMDAFGQTVCSTAGFSPQRPTMMPDPGGISADIEDDGQYLTLFIGSDQGRFVAIAIYPKQKLTRLSSPAAFNQPYTLRLNQGDETIDVVEGFDASPLTRLDRLVAPVGQLPIELEMSVPHQQLTASETLTILLPFLMWAAAATIGWLVVDRLVLAPLLQLRKVVSQYRPGEVLEPFRRMSTPAKEIQDLGDTFRAITETVAAHEAKLELGLSHQTRLTREVHHRVKNNLQVVSSLINLHARGAKSSEAMTAYASIQRRVDALAVVHRNHYAELEENRGVAIRPLIGEIASNLRATAPPEASSLSIMLDVPAYFVTQDVAVPVAFMITELVELAMLCDPAARIDIVVTPVENEDRACLCIRSPALVENKRLRERMAERYGRVIEGLSRQLRAPLDRDPAAGSFSVCFTTAPQN
jgi:two-component sensor histidine kinase